MKFLIFFVIIILLLCGCVNGNDNGNDNGSQLRYNFTPKEDITSYELAVLIKYRGFSHSFLAALPDNVKRHLTEVIVDEDGNEVIVEVD